MYRNVNIDSGKTFDHYGIGEGDTLYISPYHHTGEYKDKKEFVAY